MRDDEIISGAGRGEFLLYALVPNGSPTDPRGIPLARTKTGVDGKTRRYPHLYVFFDDREVKKRKTRFYWKSLRPEEFLTLLKTLGLRVAKRENGLPRWVVGNDPAVRL